MRWKVPWSIATPGPVYLMKTADSLWFNAPHGPEAPVRLPIRFLCVIGCPRTTGAAPA